VTESQNHRMVGVGRDLCGSSSTFYIAKLLEIIENSGVFS